MVSRDKRLSKHQVSIKTAARCLCSLVVQFRLLFFWVSIMQKPSNSSLDHFFLFCRHLASSVIHLKGFFSLISQNLDIFPQEISSYGSTFISFPSILMILFNQKFFFMNSFIQEKVLEITNLLFSHHPCTSPFLVAAQIPGTI